MADQTVPTAAPLSALDVTSDRHEEYGLCPEPFVYGSKHSPHLVTYLRPGLAGSSHDTAKAVNEHMVDTIYKHKGRFGRSAAELFSTHEAQMRKKESEIGKYYEYLFQLEAMHRPDLLPIRDSLYQIPTQRVGAIEVEQRVAEEVHYDVKFPKDEWVKILEEQDDRKAPLLADEARCHRCRERFTEKETGVAFSTLPPSVLKAWRCPHCKICEICRREDEENMLFCDRCDRGFHTYCLQPPLAEIPQGDWLCERCERYLDGDESVLKPAELTILAHFRTAEGKSFTIDTVVEVVKCDRLTAIDALHELYKCEYIVELCANSEDMDDENGASSSSMIQKSAATDSVFNEEGTFIINQSRAVSRERWQKQLADFERLRSRMLHCSRRAETCMTPDELKAWTSERLGAISETPFYPAFVERDPYAMLNPDGSYTRRYTRKRRVSMKPQMSLQSKLANPPTDFYGGDGHGVPLLRPAGISKVMRQYVRKRRARLERRQALEQQRAKSHVPVARWTRDNVVGWMPMRIQPESPTTAAEGNAADNATAAKASGENVPSARSTPDIFQQTNATADAVHKDANNLDFEQHPLFGYVLKPTQVTGESAADAPSPVSEEKNAAVNDSGQGSHQ